MKNLLKSLLKRIFLVIYSIVLPENYSEYIKLKNRKKTENDWRRKNEHNYTKVGNEISELPFPIDKVIIGNYTYGAIKVFSYGSNDEMLTIGSFCSIAPNVKFILGGMHHLNHFSTYPFKAYFQNQNESFSKGPIIVQDDVWIGTDVIVLSGVKIAQGTVVAAGSVVTKSTLPYSIVGGNPAQLIKKRFSEEFIERLLAVDFSSFNPNFIINNIDILYSELNVTSIDQFLSRKIKNA